MFFHYPHKMKYSCYQDSPVKLVCLFHFGAEESFPTKFNESESWTWRLLQQSTGKVSDLTYSLSGAASLVSSEGAPQLSEISYIYDPIYDITSGCRVAALFSSEAQRLKPQKPNSWVTLDYKQRKTRHDIPQNHAVEWTFLQLYGAWYSLPAVNTLNCGHRRFPHSIPLRKLYFDWWLL